MSFAQIEGFYIVKPKRFLGSKNSAKTMGIAKPLRLAGLVNTIEIVPNANAAVIYRAGTRISDVLESLEIITADLRHRARTEAKKR